MFAVCAEGIIVHEECLHTRTHCRTVVPIFPGLCALFYKHFLVMVVVREIDDRR